MVEVVAAAAAALETQRPVAKFYRIEENGRRQTLVERPVLVNTFSGNAWKELGYDVLIPAQ